MIKDQFEAVLELTTNISHLRFFSVEIYRMEDHLRQELIIGLTSTPMYIPVWYHYDDEGSCLSELSRKENNLYYFHRSEMKLLPSIVEVSFAFHLELHAWVIRDDNILVDQWWANEKSDMKFHLTSWCHGYKKLRRIQGAFVVIIRTRKLENWWFVICFLISKNYR